MSGSRATSGLEADAAVVVADAAAEERAAVAGHREVAVRRAVVVGLDQQLRAVAIRTVVSSPSNHRLRWPRRK